MRRKICDKLNKSSQWLQRIICPSIGGEKGKGKKMSDKPETIFLEADKFITSMDSDGKVTIKFRFANQRHPEDEEKYVSKKIENQEMAGKYTEFLQKQFAAGAKIWISLSSEVQTIECESRSSSNGMK